MANTQQSTGAPGSFPLGRLFSTANAARQLPPEEVMMCMARHSQCDWGDVDKHDRRANDQALVEGTRLFSVYHTSARQKFWIITEADRSMTTVLLPEDY
jgi:hypothetical protein